MNTWKLIPHNIDRDAALHWTRENKRIAVGWGKIGVLRLQNFTSPDDIKAAIQKSYPVLIGNNPRNGSRSLWNFWREMQRGDLVIIRPAKSSRVVVRVLDEYIYDDQNRLMNDDYFHQRRVEFTTFDAEKVWRDAGGAPATGEGIYQTLLRVGFR